jgi:hypothetical protein
MGVFSRAVAHWEAGGYGTFLATPAAQPGLVAAIWPDWRLGFHKERMLDLQDTSMVRGLRCCEIASRISADCLIV